VGHPAGSLPSSATAARSRQARASVRPGGGIGPMGSSGSPWPKASR
jgi:hypothetical protein